MKKIKVLFITILIILVGVISYCIFYVDNYYHADNVKSYMESTENVKVKKVEYGYFFDGPGEEKALIFYPGAKVEETAYAPIMKGLAENGVDCFLVKMPCRLAIFGMNRANKIIEKYSYDNWSIGGHSLGGAMAANYAYKNSDKIKNVFLLGSYSTKNLSEKDINTYFIYGSNDKVLSKDKLEESKNKLSDNYDEFLIKGGNHACFGSYGTQNGDGEASISKEEQWNLTINKICEVLIY